MAAQRDDEYEILPHQLLSDLKSEVEALKKKLTQPDTKMNELILEIESLKDSVHELTVIFQRALEEAKQEGDITKVVQQLTGRIDDVVRQNETIAKGMIAISDKLEDFMSKQSSSIAPPLGMMPRPASMQHTMGMPPMLGRAAPMPPSMDASFMGSPGDDLDLPPPPPKNIAGKKKVGLFS